MPKLRGGMMRFGLFKKTPRVRLIKRDGGPPSPATLPANERKALFWFTWLGAKPIVYVFWGHGVFMSVAYLLVMFWPPYQQAFFVTNWIADILPHSIFGILTVTQEQLDNVGAALPRAAYIHFIVPQLTLATIHLLWALLNCRRYWRLYPDYESYHRRVYVNFDEQKASITRRKKILGLFSGVVLLAMVIWPAISPDVLLAVIDDIKKPGLFYFHALVVSWFGVAPLFMGLTFVFIMSWRGFADVFWANTKDPKN
ncbi:hypothetical protein N9368_01620 [Alphaproteobacteria bacterium]|nr:hypothetical protein [Alphaproteobacteria bacterium]